ncbi:ABC transporter substrate-binding protein [Brachybacterium phenoliresistens]|uniref:ABC transporter substrate-binding protein n=1 Tax=Brachybacterium phenoliresistens TaxID=396014 RepID=UPI0031DBF11F
MTTSSLTRRRFTAGLAGTALLTALTACGGSGDDTADGASDQGGAGGWTYTDGRGVTLELDAMPTRIAAFADYALVLLSYGITPVAVFGRTDVASDPRFAEHDLSDVAIVGNAYGEIDLEALATAAPELIITGIYPTDREGTLDTEGVLYAFADLEQQGQIEKIAPVAAVVVGGAGLEVIEALVELSEAVGADPAAIASAKTDFETARDALTAASEARPEIELTRLYADASGIYLVKTADEPVTQMYAEFGVRLTTLVTDGDFYWDIYSWENAADMMTGDVLLLSDEGFQQADMEAQPTFADDPALVAGQVVVWPNGVMSYAYQAAQMTALAETITTAQDVVPG